MNPIFPEALESYWTETLGEECGKLKECLLRTVPPVSIRLHPLKGKALEGKVSEGKWFESKVPWATDAFYLKERPQFTKDPLFHSGAYYVQEASSMFIEKLFVLNTQHKQNLKVLDLCAAPGGKSTHIASLLKSTDLLISNEIHPKRHPALWHNMTKWGMSNTWVTRANPSDFIPMASHFDCIIVDAPCSGEGMMRKDAFALQQWSPHLVESCAITQKSLLSIAMQLLKPGGLLIYSTCTFNRIENEKQIESLPEGQFGPAKEIEDYPEIFRTQTKGITGYRFFPHQLEGEGFFCAALLKQGESPMMTKAKRTKDPYWKEALSPPPTEFQPLPSTEWLYLQNQKDQLFAIQREHSLDWDLLKSCVEIASPTLLMGTTKNKDFIPSGPLAWSLDFSHYNKKVALNMEESIAYLRGQTPYKEGLEKGWNLVTFGDLPMGWIKNLGSRWNNYYPLEYRIQKT
jgi:16S rRNA C967 or C1407 C5-methylase (RsmB/RsmF family)/NOL1/NOP2/fmu family ribosome biogenesis protein